MKIKKELTLENIELVIDRKIENLEVRLEERLEVKLEQKLEQKLEEKLEKKFDEKLAPIYDLINKLWAKQVEMNTKLDVALDTIISHNDRISNAETKMSIHGDQINLMDIRVRLLEARMLGSE